MAYRPLYPACYFLAAAFLLAWAARWVIGIYCWLRRGPTSQIWMEQKKTLPWLTILTASSGLIFGWAVISWAADSLVREWLLLSLPALILLGCELRLSKHDLSFLAVMALMTGLRNQSAEPDFAKRLIRVMDALPPGVVQRAAYETLQRRRSGVTIEQSCRALNNLHPLLNEMLFYLRLSGWQANLAFDIALYSLIRRAQGQWDCASRTMVLREFIDPFLSFLQVAALAGLAVLVFQVVPPFNFAWVTYGAIAWFAFASILAAGILYAAASSAWLRRVVVSALLIASLVALWQYGQLPRLFELQRQMVTHWSRIYPMPKEDLHPLTQPGLLNAADLLQPRDRNSPPLRPTTIPTLTISLDQQPPILPQRREVVPKWLIPCCRPR